MMMQAVREGLIAERPAETSSQDELLYARKTYRYLRVAIVSMVVTLLICTLLQSLDAGSWLGSLSAYYFTPVHAIFIGALIMIGICLIAIRGTTDPEDIILNIAGMCAPIVALVPTAHPNETGYKNLFPEDLPLPAMQSNNVASLGIAAIFAVVLSFWISSGGRLSVAAASMNSRTRLGFLMAAVTITGLAVVHAIGGSQWTHNGSAALLILGLWLVATINSVRSLRNRQGVRSWGHQLQVGITGSAILLGATLLAMGLFRLVTGHGSIVLLAGVGVVAITVLAATGFGWPNVTTWFRESLRGTASRFERSYFLIAATMVVGGPVFGLWPGDFEHRTLWVELAELIPFGVFWIIQTAENWNDNGAEAVAV